MSNLVEEGSNLMQKLRCNLSPVSVGDPAIGNLLFSLKAPTDLLHQEKLSCYGIEKNFNDILKGFGMKRLHRNQL